MQMQRKFNGDIYEIGFKVMWLLTIVLYIAIPLHKESVQRLCYYGFYLISFSLFFVTVVYETKGAITKLRFKELMLIFGILTIIIFSLFSTQYQITFNYQIAGILNFFTMICSVYYITKLKNNVSIEKFIFIINLMISVIFMLLSISSYAYSGILNSLYLGYQNPNATASYILLNVAILLIYFPKLQKRYVRISVFVVICYLIYLIYLTDSRTCMFVGLLLFAYTFLPLFLVLPKWTITAALLVPIIFLFGYSAMYANGMLMDFDIMGKPIYSGREVFFIYQLENLRKHFWIGDIGKYAFNNLHNSALACLASMGALGYGLYLILIRNELCRLYEKITTKQQVIAMAVILSIYLQSVSEAALVVGGAHYSITIATYYYLLNGNGGSRE